MKIFKFNPRENITGPEMAEILAAGSGNYASLPARLHKHFEIIVIPDPVRKVKPPESVIPAALPVHTKRTRKKKG
jgi:hypothetical protein